MDSLQSAIDNGISMLNKCYEKVPLDLDDSDEEDDPEKKCHFFRPKDPYLDRATPFVIGSKEWKEKWHIGLVESEDESEEDIPEEFSDSSDGNSLSISLNVQTVSESDGSLWEQDRLDNQSASPISNKNNLPKAGDEIKNNPSTSKNVRLFPEEPPEDKTTKQKGGLFDDFDNESFKKTQSKVDGNFFREQSTDRKTVNLFDDEPPELDFVPNNNKPTNLFAESDDDDNFISNRSPSKKISIFDDKPPPDDIFVENKKSNQPKKKVNLFDEDEFFSYIQDIKDKPQTKPVKSNIFDDVPDDSKISSIKEKVTQKKISNLFSDDVEDDLFDSIIKKDVKPLNEEKEEKAVPVIEEVMVKKRAYKTGEDDNTIVKKIPSVSKKSNIFDDLPPEDDFDIFRTKTPAKSDKKKRNLFEDLSDEDSINKSSNVAKTKPKKSSANFEEDIEKDIIPSTSKLGNTFSKEQKTSKDSGKSKLESLFSDEPHDNDLFSQIIPKHVSKPETKDLTPATSKLGNLFNDESSEDPEQDIFSKSSKKLEKPKLASLFGDEPPEDDLFSQIIAKKVTKTEKPLTSLTQDVKKDNIPTTSKSGGIFSNDSSEEPDKDIFSKNSKKTETNNEHPAKQEETISKQEQGIVIQSNSKIESLFGDEPPEDDLFSKRITKVVSNPEKSASPKLGSIFDKSSKEPKKSEKNKLESLFNDEPPDDDLFSKITKKVSKPERSLEQDIKKIPSASALGSLFSDDSSEEPEKDIFLKDTKKLETNEQSSKQEETISKPEQTEQEIEKEKDILKSTSKIESLFSEKPEEKPLEDDMFSKSITKEVTKPEKSLQDLKQQTVNDITLASSKLGSIFNEVSSEKHENDNKVSDPEKNLPNLEQEIDSPSISKLGSLLSSEPPKDDDIFAAKTNVKIDNSEDEDKQKVDEEVVSTPGNEIFSSTANSPLSKSNKNKNLFSFTSTVLDEEIPEPKQISSDNAKNKSISDKIEEDIEINESETLIETKTPIISPQFNFLDEEPPLDPEIESWSNKSSFSTPEQSHIEKSESVKPISGQSALKNYPSIGLFDDLPPDDDDVDKIPSMPYTKTSHVYYDDTDLFLPITNPINISPNLNLLNEEPPPVDDFVQPKDEIDFKDKLNLFLTPENKIIEKEKIDVPIKISVSDLIQARTSETKPVESPKKQIQPKKLNKNLSINVAALLPGAKRPSLKVAIVNDDRNSPDGDSENIVIETTPKFNNTPETSNPDILPSLSKSRAKIQVKRRPSTRRGRQENYRKSVHINDEEDNPLESSDEKDLNKNKLSTKLVDEIITTPRSSHVDDESIIFKKVDVKKRESSALLKKDKENNVSRRVTDSLFSSDDDDPLFSPVVKKIEKTVEVVISTKSKEIPNAKPILKIEKTKKNEKSIFGSEDDDDDLFGKSTQKVKSVKTIDKNKNNMFGDSDDDGEDIFSVKKPKGKKFKKN